MAPPTPRRSRYREWLAVADRIGLTPYPWQELAARIAMAVEPTPRLVRLARWLYAEAAFVVARQQGKSTLLVPRIIAGLRAGENVLHTAQNRELPREIFGQVGEAIAEHYPDELIEYRTANGQELIRVRVGGGAIGRYRIVAPTRKGARGFPRVNLLLIDEVRELDTWEFIAAARPTLTAAYNPQTWYLSNAGEATSVVLNAIRRRAELDAKLAYLEWSAAPGLAIDDRLGWRQANPSWGFNPDVERNLENAFATYALEGELATFETEHLCRWVVSMMPALVADLAWQRAAGEPGDLARPSMAIAVDPKGRRASAVIAWRRPADGRVGVRLAADVVADGNLDVDKLGDELAKLARRLSVRRVGFDPATDRDLARHFGDRAQAITADSLAAAGARFVSTVEGGRLVWAPDAAPIGADLPFTARSETAAGTWRAVAADDDRAVTAALAAIRAVWLATEPRPPAPSIS